MCDYSLMGVPNRLACDDEDLVVRRFKTGSLGLSPAGSRAHIAQSHGIVGKARSIVRMLGSKLSGLAAEPVAACVPPGARLLLRDIPVAVQCSCNVGAFEEVIFTQLTAAEYEYRDAVRFQNGHEMLLQELRAGQRVRVLQLSLPGEQPVPLPAYVEEFFPTHAAVDLIAPRSFRAVRGASAVAVPSESHDE
jgi:hypothetical protein